MRQFDGFVRVSRAKSQLHGLVRRLGERDEVVAITRDGEPVAVLLSPARFEGLLEAIEVLSDPRAMGSLRRSQRQARRGRWVSHESLFGKEKTGG